MLWLGLDGALGPFSAALVSSTESDPVRTATAGGADALERGLGIVDDVLGGRALAEVGAIAVGTGPGGFTGLRIALSYAKSLALGAGLPLVGVSSYDALEPPDAAGTYATFVHGRAGVACVRLRGAGPELVACGSYEDLAHSIAARLERPRELVCYGRPEGTAPALGERGFTVRAIPLQTVPALAVARRAFGRPASSPHAVVADYGEAPYYASRGPAGNTPDPRNRQPT